MGWKILNLSEASILGLHAASLLAAGEERLTTGEIASVLSASEAHLSKVLQRMTKAGLLRSARGPGGGFTLNKPAEEISLLDVYEAMEGPLKPQDCLLEARVCAGNNCLFGSSLARMNAQFEDYLRQTTLARVKDVIGDGRHAEKDSRDR